jgi:hypothetical protein
MCQQEKYSEVKRGKASSILGMSAEFTFLAQFQPKLAMRVR